jgi:hypothetical protein
MTSHQFACDQSILSGQHGRQRRQERNISKADGKLARRLGMKELAEGGKVKYTYKGCVFIVDVHSNKEITCYLSKDWASPFSGTCKTEPVLVAMKKNNGSSKVQKFDIIERSDNSSVHTIFVVDMSSHMRQDDMDGARCRSDGVFYSIATGFVESILSESSINQQQTLVSLILMHDNQAYLRINRKPVDESLFNQLVDLREWSTCRPNGDAKNYQAGLYLAHDLIVQSTTSCCCDVKLCIIAGDDDVPLTRDPERKTANDQLANVVKNIANIGNDRLFFQCIGLGHDSDSFVVMKELVAVASQQGTVANFQKSTLDVHMLYNALSNLHATAVQSSNMTSSPIQQSTTLTVSNVYMWNLLLNDFGKLIDRRCQTCYALVGDVFLQADPKIGWQCASCQTCYFCVGCIQQFTWHLGSQSCMNLASKKGEFVQKSVPTYLVLLESDAPVDKVAFSGREIRFLNSSRQRQPVGPCFAGKELGADEFKRIDPVLLNDCRRITRASAIATDYANRFALELQESHSNGMSRYPRIQISPVFIIETEGGGCYLVQENSSSTVSAKAEDDAMNILGAFCHFTFERSDKCQLVVGTNNGISFDSDRNPFLVVTSPTLYTKPNANDTMSGDIHHFLRSHKCGVICKKLGL